MMFKQAQDRKSGLIILGIVAVIAVIGFVLIFSQASPIGEAIGKSRWMPPQSQLLDLGAVLEEGQKSTYELGQAKYEIEVPVICETCQYAPSTPYAMKGSVRFRVNGVLTPELFSGQPYPISKTAKLMPVQVYPSPDSLRPSFVSLWLVSGRTRLFDLGAVLEEGQKSTYELGNAKYEIEVPVICETCQYQPGTIYATKGSVRFRVNGVLTPELFSGQPYVISKTTKLMPVQVYPSWDSNRASSVSVWLVTAQ